MDSQLALGVLKILHTITESTFRYEKGQLVDANERWGSFGYLVI